MDIRMTSDPADAQWLSLRTEFIPELSRDANRAFLETLAHDSRGFLAFVASDDDGEPLGFAEVSIRSDYVNGCRYRPALFLEGIFVRPDQRRRGVAHALCAAAEAWARERGCREFASDVYIDDGDSLAAHLGLGFEETERVVFLRKLLTEE